MSKILRYLMIFCGEVERARRNLNFKFLRIYPRFNKGINTDCKYPGEVNFHFSRSCTKITNIKSLIKVSTCLFCFVITTDTKSITMKALFSLF